MGLNTHSLRILLDWVRKPSDLGKTLTLGRLLLVPGRYESREDFYRLLEAQTAHERSRIRACDDAADVLRLLGATSVDALDRSDYEGAELLHDLNHPLPSRYHGTFDTVIDGGTLEHVFNFPTALKSCMELVNVGGHLVICTPMNNQPGHGFYQFTPELFFRVFCEENGYEVELMMAYEKFTGGWHYRISDPADLGRRLRLVTDYPVDLMVIARRTRVTTVIGAPPQQSDYVVDWREGSGMRGWRSKEGWQRRLVRTVRVGVERVAPSLHHAAQAWIERRRRSAVATFERQTDAFERVSSRH